MTTATVQSADGDLLRLYAREKNQDAFTRIVRRHVDWVYSAALRATRDTGLAEDVTQGVFLALAQKSDRLVNHPNIAGWLFQATQFGARAALKRERRRRHIEAQAMQMLKQLIEADRTWDQIAGRLEEAVGRLRAPDREAILLRFYQQLSHPELAAALGIPEDAARMRVTRAVARLREKLGVAAPAGTAALTNALAAHAITPAPATLTTSITAATHTPSAIAMGKSIKLTMTLTKLKFAAAVVVIALVPIATAAAIQHAYRTPVVAPPIPVAAAVPIPLPPPVAQTVILVSTTTAPTRRIYTGWVHITYGESHEPVSHISIDAGIYAECSFPHAPGASIPAIPTVAYLDFAAGLEDEYDPDANAIHLELLAPPRYGVSRPTVAQPICTTNYSDLLAQLGAATPERSLIIAKSSERGLDRYDIALADSAPQMSITFRGGTISAAPTTFWVDAKTDLIQEYGIGGSKRTLTYGGPAITSIYDLGVPKDAKVIDDRPAPETVAVFDRVTARAEKPFPDGVVILLNVSTDITTNPAGRSKPQFTFHAYGRTGNKWAHRLVPLAPAGSEEGKVQMPENWQDSGADEFFRRLAATIPTSEIGGDGTALYEREYDPVTGETSHSEFITHAGPDGTTGKMTREKIAGDKVTTGSAAHYRELDEMPNHWLFPQEAVGGLWARVGHHLDLLTSADRPGQLALRSTTSTALIGREKGTETVEEWIDPAHDDRAVTFITTYQVIETKVIPVRYVTQFGDYATLPAPDGRSYPTTWTRTRFNPDAEGKLVPSPQSKTIFHFFPGRTLPPIPKQPAP